MKGDKRRRSIQNTTVGSKYTAYGTFHLIVILAIFHSNNPIYATGILTTVISHSTATQSTVRNINHLIIGRSKNCMEYLNLAHRTGHTLAFNPITYLKRAKQQDDKSAGKILQISG